MNDLAWMIQKEIVSTQLSQLADIANKNFADGLITAKQHEAKIKYICDMIDFISISDSLIYELRAENSLFLDLLNKTITGHSKKTLYDRIGINKG